MIRLEFRYTRPDVVAAQRMRFLRSRQFKIILIVWFLSMLFFIVQLVLPQVFPPGPNTSWAAVLQIAIAFMGALLVLTFITPWMDFYINRFWRLQLSLHFSEKSLHIFVTGKTGGLRLRWNQVRRVDENKRVFILEYGAGGKYIVLPKSAFTGAGDERRFRDLLARREAVKDAPSEDGDDDIEQE